MDLTLISLHYSLRRKEFERCSLFRDLLLIPTFDENAASQLYGDENGTSILLVSR